MRFRTSLTGLFAIAQVTSAIPQAIPGNVKRQALHLLDSYDFVIAGGGTSGLTLADRLTQAFPDSLLHFTLVLHIDEREMD
jgi:choline dehydrogenase